MDFKACLQHKTIDIIYLSDGLVETWDSDQWWSKTVDTKSGTVQKLGKVHQCSISQFKNTKTFCTMLIFHWQKEIKK